MATRAKKSGPGPSKKRKMLDRLNKLVEEDGKNRRSVDSCFISVSTDRLGGEKPEPTKHVPKGGSKSKVQGSGVDIYCVDNNEGKLCVL